MIAFHPLPNLPPRVSVRPLSHSDLDGFVAYFTGLSREACARMGIDPARIPPATQLRSEVQAVMASPSAHTFILSWCLEGSVVGHSSLKDIIPGEFGTMHLHLWRTDLRGQGYGARLFCLSALHFYERFDLKRIICEPKSDNVTPNRMLQKVGFPLVLTHVAASSELTLPAEVNRYEIVREIAEMFIGSSMSVEI